MAYYVVFEACPSLPMDFRDLENQTLLTSTLGLKKDNITTKNMETK